MVMASIPPVGSSTHAREVGEGRECLITFDDIDETNYCEYQTEPSMLWYPALACSDAIEHLRQTQFKRYMERVQATDCAAEMKRLMTKGPPIYFEESNVAPLPDGETRIVKLWYMADDTERSAMLDEALDGDERQKLWDHLKSVHQALSDKTSSPSSSSEKSTPRADQDEEQTSPLPKLVTLLL